MTFRMQWLAHLAGVAALAAVLGCSGPVSSPLPVAPSEVAARVPSIGDDAPTGPGETDPGRLFYPLDLGNHWVHTRDVTVVSVPDGGPPETIFEESGTLETDHVDVVEHEGREYVLERYTIHTRGREFVSEALVRQDRHGLHEADKPIARDLARADGMAGAERRARDARQLATLDLRPAQRRALAHALDRHDRIVELASRAPRASGLGSEITRLAYPLRPGATWRLRPDPLVTYTVEGMDALDLPGGRFVGWRLRVEAEYLDPDDRVRIWYGRDGYLQLTAHTVVTITDSQGNPVGHVVVDETHRLKEQLRARPRH